MAKKLQTPNKPVITINPIVLANQPFIVSNTVLLALTIGMVAFYFLFSNTSNGFYQQDEAAHYVSMLNFWNNPNNIIGNWEKPGYKFIYVIPALLGKPAVMLLNCLFSAFSCFFAYRVAEKLGGKVPLLAFIFLAFQPLWAGLAFRNYSELISAFLLIVVVYFYLHDKLIFSALLASYICFIRQEFYPMLGLYFLWLAYRKQFVPAILLSVFPLIHNFWGMALTGDFLYLLHSILGTSQKIGDAYARAGFEHYFRFSVVIYGAICVPLFIAYIAAKITQRQHPPYIAFLPVVLYFMMYCIFNIQSFPIGPSSAGNLRYLVIVSPLIAVFAALAIDEVQNTKNKTWIFASLGLLIIVAAIYMSYEHNFIRFDEANRDWKILIGLFFVSVLLVIPLSTQQYTYSFLTLTLFMTLITLKPIKLSKEDKKCQEVAAWYLEYEKANGEPQLLYHHDMFSYYLNKPKGSFKTPVKFISEENAEKLPKGSLILWDSHYGYRPELRKTDVTYEYFTKQPEKYELLQQFISEDQAFGTLVFRKL